MATTLYLRAANMAASPATRLSSTLRGASATTVTGTTTSGGTWISLGHWATRALEAFTLSGSISMNLRGDESNTQANAGLGLRVYKWTASGGLGSQLVQINNTTELGTSEAVRTGSGTPTSTSFAAGDLLVVEVGIIAAGGTMGANRTVTLYIDGPTASASGDSYFTITENILLRDRARATT